jgi:outer membrane cobalamin receptor
MNRTIRICTHLWIFLLLLAPPLFAIGTPEDQSQDIFQLGEVTVTATTMNPIEAGQTVHEITAEEIKSSNARTLDEVLVLLSDINVKLGVDGVPRVEIRGFKAKDILVLLDGVPINSAFDGQFDPSTIPVDSIAKIKVTTGASSVLYGQGGLGGVINIITKRGEGALKGEVGYEGGNGTPYLAKASLSGSSGKYDFFASTSAYHRDAFPLAKSFTSSVNEQSGYRTNSDNTRNNAFLSLGFTPDSDLHIALTGNFVEGGYGKPLSAINNNFDPFAPPARFGRVPNYEGSTFQLAADYTPSDALSVRSRVYYNRMAQDNDQYDNQNYNSFNNPLIPNSYYLRNTATNTGASVQPKYDFGKAGAVTLGFSGERQTWVDAGAVKPGGEDWAQGGHGVGAGSPPYILYPVSDHYDVEVYSTAVEYSVSPLKNLGFAVGYGYHWQIREDRDLDGYSISASTYYDILQGTRLKLAFMRNIQFPTLSQLYLRDTDNPKLVTERVYQYQLGAEQKLPWKSLFKINGFYSDLYNFIGLKYNVTPQQGYDPYNVNYPFLRFYGIESSAETSFLKNLLLKIGYTLNVSRDLSGPEFVENKGPVQYVPKYKTTFTGRYDFGCGLSAFVSTIYVADSWVYSKQQYVTVIKAQMADYVVTNLKLSQRLFKDRVSVYIGADNLFNKDYEDTYGIPRPGRYVYAGFDYRFGL